MTVLGGGYFSPNSAGWTGTQGQQDNSSSDDHNNNTNANSDQQHDQGGNHVYVELLLCTGAILIFLVSIWLAYRRRRESLLASNAAARIAQESAAKDKGPIKKDRALLMTYLEESGNQMVVKKDDLVTLYSCSSLTTSPTISTGGGEDDDGNHEGHADVVDLEVGTLCSAVECSTNHHQPQEEEEGVEDNKTTGAEEPVCDGFIRHLVLPAHARGGKKKDQRGYRETNTTEGSGEMNNEEHIPQEQQDASNHQHSGTLSDDCEEPQGGGAGVPSSRTVDCCAICLEDYKEGDRVLWSADIDCPHVFHCECMVDFIMAHRGDNSPCPMCRRDFFRNESPFSSIEGGLNDQTGGHLEQDEQEELTVGEDASTSTTGSNSDDDDDDDDVVPANTYAVATSH